ncbi:cytochrome b [Thalassotalea sp. 42_200_T64]|nr:cytochrome b [Thalassotalea sp. 42_200_T64]
MINNTRDSYGVISKSLHWVSGLTIIALFALGFWMVDLSYYSQWYKTAPHWHKSLGILLLALTIIRLLVKAKQEKVLAIASHSNLVKKTSSFTHKALYLLMVSVFVSGYLISTADGRAIEVFDWFSVVSLGAFVDNQEDLAGIIHRYVAYSLIALALLHAMAAIKHHLIDKDDTLKRMLK